MVFGEGSGTLGAMEAVMSSLRSRLTQGFDGIPRSKGPSSRVNALLEQLCKLKNDLGGPTGPYTGTEPQLFLAELDKLQCLLRVPIADRSHRRTFTRNYQQLLPDLRRRYRQDVVVAALEKPSPLFVNGTRFDATPDVSTAGSSLVAVWTAVVEAAGKKQLAATGGLLEKFDAAYADFERKYLTFLIATEASCKSIVEDCSRLAQRIHAGEDLSADFVAMMQQLNSLANTAGKGRQDLGLEILAEAQALTAQGTGLPRMCGKVEEAYHRAIDYFAEVGKNMDKVDPHLARNRELVQTLAAWEESWERAKPYMQSVRLRHMLCAFVADVNQVCEENPTFAEAVGGSDVEAILLLPQLFGAFCAYHGDASAELLELAAETTSREVALDAVQSCQTVHAYRDVLRTIAAGEVEPELRACGMRLQRSQPTQWNNFLVTVIGELE